MINKKKNEQKEYLIDIKLCKDFTKKQFLVSIKN